MTGLRPVADEHRASDAELGQLSRRYAELFDRARRGNIPMTVILQGMQNLIEGMPMPSESEPFDLFVNGARTARQWVDKLSLQHQDNDIWYEPTGRMTVVRCKIVTLGGAQIGYKAYDLLKRQGRKDALDVYLLAMAEQYPSLIESGLSVARKYSRPAGPEDDELVIRIATITNGPGGFTWNEPPDSYSEHIEGDRRFLVAV